jgi:diguanylate cyclase (GGDEF)-like protein
MTSPEPAHRDRPVWTRRAFAVLLTAAIVGTAGFVGYNAVLLAQVNAAVQSTQSQSLNLANTQREALRLLNEVSELDDALDPAAVDVQRGLLFRQISVATASYPAGSAEARELTEVREALQRFPWDRLATAGPAAQLDPLAVALVSQAEKRLHGLLVQEEQGFYAATAASLDTAQRGQVSSAVLVGLLLVLSWTAVSRVSRRSRSALAVANDQLYHQAHHDSLTGLPNRALLVRRLRSALRADPDAVAVLLIDLDGFKNVNDTLGHPAGDELLRIAAQRLAGCLRDADTAARLGGDEFAVLSLARRGGAAASPATAGADALRVGQRIVEVLHRPYRVAGQDVRVSASIGVTRGGAGASAEDLIRDADIAMYAAKNTGKGRVAAFDPQMRTRAAQRTSMQQELAEAVELGEIEAHYQPIIDLQTLRPTTLEALARWRPRGRPAVPADRFIAVAEETGAIAGIGRAVLRSACHELRRWRELPGHEGLAVAVNVSVQQMLSGRIVADVEEALADSGLPGAALVLEITESAALEDSAQVAATLAQLRAAGVRIAVDDFGAGYSSLSCLMRLPADLLKIDRTLLDFVTTRDGSLVTAVAELGRTLGLVVVVEGVETPDHLARAREAACDAAQGFHFSRPMPAADVPAYLRGWPAPRTAGQGAGRAGR